MTTGNVEAAGKPIKTLLVSFEVPADCPDGLGFMVTIVEQAEGKFKVRLTDPEQGARAAPVPVPDFSGLIVPRIEAEPGLLISTLHASSKIARMFDARNKHARREAEAEGREAVRRVEQDLTAQRAVSLRAPPSPRSYADLVKDLKVAGGEVPPPLTPIVKIAPPIAASVAVPMAPRPLTRAERLIAYLRDLKAKGEPMPGNKALAAAVGIESDKQLTVLLTNLKAQGAVDYTWGPAPTDEDPSRQMRFVTHA